MSSTDNNTSTKAFRLVTPANKKRTVAPRRRPNGDYRTREHLTATEIEKLIGATKDNRHGHRDATMVLVAFRHGLRAAELVGLRWDQVDFEGGVLHVARRKRGTPSTHPISGRELRALRRLKREAQIQSPFVFVSERGSPFSVAGFQKLVARAGRRRRLCVSVAPAHAATFLRLQARK
jgi:integrase